MIDELMGCYIGICDAILGALKLFLDVFEDFWGFLRIFEDLRDVSETEKWILMLETSNVRILQGVGRNIEVFKVVFAMCDQSLRIFEIFEIFEDLKMLLDKNCG
jgi:hypothetical protein